MKVNDQHLAFLQVRHSAAMITLRADGSAAAVRCGVALVDGKLWSSGTQDRIRTRYVRRDPRSTLFVFDTAFRWLTIEALVTIREGLEAPQDHLRLFRVMQDRPSGPLMWYGAEKTEEEFLRAMVDEKRLIYEFEPTRIYGGI